MTSVAVVAAAIAGIYFYRNSSLSSPTLARNNFDDMDDMASPTLAQLTRSNSLPNSFVGVTPPSKENLAQRFKIPATANDSTRRSYLDVLMMK